MRHPAAALRIAQKIPFSVEKGNFFLFRKVFLNQLTRIHNAANTTARGAEILAQIADKNGGPTKILAQALLDEYEKLGVPIRQIVFREGSHGDYYYTNRAAAALNIPALTSEFCFIDNEEDQKFIDSEEDWQKQARAQCNAILYYFTQVQY